MLKSTSKYVIVLIAALVLFSSSVFAQDASDQDTSSTGGTLTFPDPSNYSLEVIFDPISGNYLVYKSFDNLAFKHNNHIIGDILNNTKIMSNK